jgi:hypothetical protein
VLSKTRRQHRESPSLRYLEYGIDSYSDDFEEPTLLPPIHTIQNNIDLVLSSSLPSIFHIEPHLLRVKRSKNNFKSFLKMVRSILELLLVVLPYSLYPTKNKNNGDYP